MHFPPLKAAKNRLKAKKGGKTALSFSQTGVPAQKHGAIGKGWKAFYWGPLNKYFKA